MTALGGRLSPVSLGALLCALAAGTLTLLLTRHGVALTPDSTHYLSAAANWASHRHLLSSITPLESPRNAELFTAWPPLFPWFIALLQNTFDPLVGVRLLQASCAVWLILVVYQLSRIVLPDTWALTASAVLTLQTWWLLASAFVWSELLFIALTTTSLWLWSRGVRAHGLWWLMAAGVGAGLAGITRYMGGVWILVGTASLFLLMPRTGKQPHMVRALVFAVPAGLPPALWLWSNFRFTGFWFGDSRPEGWFSPDRVLWDAVWTLATDWLSPSLRAIEVWGWWPLIPAALGASILAVILFRSRRAWRVPRLGQGETVIALWVYGASYVAAMVAVISKVGIDPVNPRYLMPAYPALLIAGVHLVYCASGSDRRALGAPSVLGPVTACLALLSLPQVMASSALLMSAGENKKELTTPYWTSYQKQLPQDPVFLALQRLNYAGHPVISNQWELVSLATGLPVKPLPRRGHPELEHMLNLHPGSLVVLKTQTRRERTHIQELLRLGPERVEPLYGPNNGWFVFRIHSRGGHLVETH